MLKLGKARYQARARWLHVPDLFFVEEKKGEKNSYFFPS